jgi:hypothetical protein
MNTIQFNLSSPLPYLNTQITKGSFIVSYPSGLSYWQLEDEKGKVLDGNYTFSQETLSQWTDSDQVLIDALLEAEPWIVKEQPAPAPEVKPIEESDELIEETK